MMLAKYTIHFLRNVYLYLCVLFETIYLNIETGRQPFIFLLLYYLLCFDKIKDDYLRSGILKSVYFSMR